MPEYMEKNGKRACSLDYPHNGPDIPLAQWSRTKVTEGGYLDHWMQSGGLWMSTKSVLQKIGLFDEQFAQAAMEDVDIFLRARDTFGMHILMSAKSIFWHKEGATRRGWDKNWEDMCLRLERENEDKYAMKWGKYYHGDMPWKEKILRE
jgi:GT2 family glycosyltransferase